MANEKATRTDIAWIDGWSRARNGLALRVLCVTEAGYRYDDVSVDELRSVPACNPNLYPRAATRCVGFTIDDLSRLDRLINPGELAAQLRRELANTRHAIFALEMEEGRIYIPAILLLRELWLWSAPAQELLLTPHSLDLHIGRRCVKDGKAFSSATTDFCPRSRGVTDKRRLAWLAQSEDARRSWRSVLTFANQGKLDVLLPRASLRGWAWGIDLAPGLLVNSIQAAYMTFDLPEPDLPIRIGSTQYVCPPQPPRTTGYLSF